MLPEELVLLVVQMGVLTSTHCETPHKGEALHREMKAPTLADRPPTAALRVSLPVGSVLVYYQAPPRSDDTKPGLNFLYGGKR